MATLSACENAIINYCVKNGACQMGLAREFGKSKQWVHVLGQRDAKELFPDENSMLWFNAGIRASDLRRRLRPWKPEVPVALEDERSVESKPIFPFWTYKAARMEQERKLLEIRTGNLKGRCQARDSDPLIDLPAEEEEVTEEDETVNTSASVHVSNLILQNMSRNLCRASRCGWRYNEETLKFGYIVRSYSAACYEWMRKVLPLPSRVTLSRKFGIAEKTLQTSLANPENFDDIILAYFDRVSASCTMDWLQCSLCIDAFSMTVLQRQTPASQETLVNEASIEGDVDVDVAQRVNDDEEEEQLEMRSETCNNMFIIVLNPFRWEFPPVALSVFPWKNGHADSDIVEILLNIVGKLSLYNINVRAIASDGDSGYTCLHKALHTVWEQKRKKDFFRIFNLLSSTVAFQVTLGELVFKISAYPVADPLHALKIARSRFLDHVVYMTPTFSVSSESVKWITDKWFWDRTQLARMSDFYAISMFSPDTFIRCCEEGSLNFAMYVWPWTALLMVIRVPFLSLNCRISLLHSSFVFFQYFLNEMLDGRFQDSDIYIRYKKGCKGVTFFDTSYLIRVIHLVFALYGELLDGGHHLRLSAFGSHVAENMIGRIRVSCHGNHKFEVIMRAISRSEVRRLLQWELGFEHSVRGRDNAGGTKLEAGIPTDLDGLDFADLGHTIVQALREGADPPNDAFQQIALFCSKVLDRQRKVYHIYCPNSAANSGIIARLIKFASTDRETQPENPAVTNPNETLTHGQ